MSNDAGNLRSHVWRRLAHLIQLVIADAILLVLVAGLFEASHRWTHYIGLDARPVAFGIYVGDIFTGLHVANLLVNGLFLLYHLALGHRE